MQPDDELCLCFHVTQRKVTSWLRIEQPRQVAQLAECYGAGTGCGWCRPFLKKLFEASQAGAAAELPSTTEYAAGRAQYVRAGHGTPPPGATSVEE